MILGGLQKHSLIDYPGKVSCVCFLMGCNFDCPYCHNPDLVRRNTARLSPLDEQELFDFLRTRQGLLDGVVLSGGEPTLDRQLLSLCRNIKAMGYAVKLDTNGSRPEVIASLMDHDLLDYVAVDIKTDPSLYPLFIKKGWDPEALLASIRAVMEWGGEYEFRTTCVKPMVDAEIIETITGIIQGARRYALQSFRSAELLHPDFFGGMEPGYSQEQMMSFRSVAEPRVMQCMVR